MTGRRYRVVRVARTLNLMDLEILASGIQLLAGDSTISTPAGEVDLELAADAWRNHRADVEAFLQSGSPGGPVPVAWAARVFDGEPQIAVTGVDSWTAARIADIEREVVAAKADE